MSGNFYVAMKFMNCLWVFFVNFRICYPNEIEFNALMGICDISLPVIPIITVADGNFRV